MVKIMSREKKKTTTTNQDAPPVTPPRAVILPAQQTAATDGTNFGLPLGTTGQSLLEPGALILSAGLGAAATTNNPVHQNPALQQLIMQRPELVLDLQNLEPQDTKTVNQKRRRI